MMNDKARRRSLQALQSLRGLLDDGSQQRIYGGRARIRYSDGKRTLFSSDEYDFEVQAETNEYKLLIGALGRLGHHSQYSSNFQIIEFDEDVRELTVRNGTGNETYEFTLSQIERRKS